MSWTGPWPEPDNNLAQSHGIGPGQRGHTTDGSTAVSTNVRTLATPAARRGSSPMARRKALEGYLYIAPFLVGFLVFTAYPLLASLYLSFTSYNIISDPTWIGLENYQRAFFQDNQFWAS